MVVAYSLIGIQRYRIMRQPFIFDREDANETGSRTKSAGILPARPARRRGVFERPAGEKCRARFLPPGLDADMNEPDPVVRSRDGFVRGIECPGSGHQRRSYPLL